MAYFLKKYSQKSKRRGRLEEKPTNLMERKVRSVNLKASILSKKDLSDLEELAVILKEHEGQSYKEWYRILVEFKNGYIAGFNSVESQE